MPANDPWLRKGRREGGKYYQKHYPKSRRLSLNILRVCGKFPLLYAVAATDWVKKRRRSLLFFYQVYKEFKPTKLIQNILKILAVQLTSINVLSDLEKCFMISCANKYGWKSWPNLSTFNMSLLKSKRHFGSSEFKNYVWCVDQFLPTKCAHH